MLYTGEQFANKQFMESHDDVAQGVTSRQTDRRERQAAAAAPRTTSTCVKPAVSVNMTLLKDWMMPRQEARRERPRSRTT